MSQPSGPLPVIAMGSLSAATAAYWVGSALYVTVVAKATYRFVPDGVMTPIAAEPLELDTPSATRTAGDLAPCLPQAEVILRGTLRTLVPPPTTIRLGVFRHQTPVIDKTVALSTRELSPFGPLPRRTLGSLGIAGASALGHATSFPRFPQTLDWTAFQTAPPDQRLSNLSGSEWIVLAGLQAPSSLLSTQLPGMTGIARVLGGRSSTSCPLLADSLLLDVERQTCSILFRGAFPVEGPAMLGQLQVLAGLHPAAPVPAPPATSLALGSAVSREGTVLMDPPAENAGGGGSTGTIAVDDAGIPHGPALPFSPVGSGTIAIEEDLPTRPVLPFAPGWSPLLDPSYGPAPTPNPLKGATLVDEGAGFGQSHALGATPFDKPSGLLPLVPVAAPPPVAVEFTTSTVVTTAVPTPPPPPFLGPIVPTATSSVAEAPAEPITKAAAPAPPVAAEAPRAQPSPTPAPEKKLSPAERLIARTKERRKQEG